MNIQEIKEVQYLGIEDLAIAINEWRDDNYLTDYIQEIKIIGNNTILKVSLGRTDNVLVLPEDGGLYEYSLVNDINFYKININQLKSLLTTLNLTLSYIQKSLKTKIINRLPDSELEEELIIRDLLENHIKRAKDIIDYDEEQIKKRLEKYNL